MTAQSPTEEPQALAPGLTDQTGFLIQQLHNQSRRIFNEALRPLEIEARHVGVLAVLAKRGPLIQRQLIDLLGIDKSSLVYVLDDLQNERLVERRSVPHDRRAFEVHITKSGHKRLNAAMQTAKRIHNELFGWLDPNDRKQFHRTLEQLIDRLATRPTSEEVKSPVRAKAKTRRAARRSETRK